MNILVDLMSKIKNNNDINFNFEKTLEYLSINNKNNIFKKSNQIIKDIVYCFSKLKVKLSFDFYFKSIDSDENYLRFKKVEMKLKKFKIANKDFNEYTTKKTRNFLINEEKIEIKLLDESLPPDK